MGERKGQNFYYPADFNYKVHKNLNNYHGTHALRERAKKIKEGILVIRFEMPFNVWCLGCNNHVGMGVRYNAEKKKIGMYYTTPLYEFRMKCHLCSNYFTIRTDPKNFDYEMVEGLRRQEKRFDPSTVDNLAPIDRNFTHILGADAMLKKEHDIDDKNKIRDVKSQIENLEYIQSRMYDDYTANSLLRKSFRNQKEIINEKRLIDEDLKQRLSTNLPLQPENNDDRIMARQMLRLGNLKDSEKDEDEAKSKILSRPVFASQSDQPSTSSFSNRSKDILLKNIQKVKVKNSPAFNVNFKRSILEINDDKTREKNEFLKKKRMALGISIETKKS